MIERVVPQVRLKGILLTCRRVLLSIRPLATRRAHEKVARDLLTSNRVDEAEAVYRRMTQRFRKSPVGHLGLAMVAHSRDDLAAAEAHWGAVEGPTEDCSPDERLARRVKLLLSRGLASYAVKLGLQLLESQRSGEARRTLEEIHRARPENLECLRALMRVAEYEEVPREELRLLNQVLEREPRSRNLKLRKSALLRELGQVEESEALLATLEEAKPGDLKVGIERARNATEARDYLLATERWKALSEQAPKNAQIQISYIQSLLDNVEFDKAQEHLDACSKRMKPKQLLTTQVDVYRAQAEWQKAAEAADKLCQTDPDQLSLQRRKANLLLSMYRKYHDPEMLNWCLETARRLMEWKPENFGNRIFLIQVLLLLEAFDEAVSEIDQLPDIKSERVLRLRAWKQQYQGDDDAAKEIWNEIQRVHYVPQTAALDTVQLERRDTNALEIARDEITVYSVVRNERWRLPWFLSYYRDLGVDRFIFVDNDSDDGTREYLLEQPDVHVFWTNGSYAKAYSGMRWVNNLVETYGDGAWCMYVDVDEAFVFPGVESKGLKDLTAYMASQGHEALFAHMMDMFAEEEQPQEVDDESIDFVAQYPFFDSYFKHLPSIYCPWYYVAGGARRKFGYHENQTKTPIIRGGKGIRFLMSSHCTTPAVLTDVTAVMLHFKLAGAYRDAFEADSDDNTRMPYCKQRHAAYARCLDDNDGRLSFVDGNTVRYESSEQLRELGLIQAPEAFLAPLDEAKDESVASEDGQLAPEALGTVEE